MACFVSLEKQLSYAICTITCPSKKKWCNVLHREVLCVHVSVTVFKIHFIKWKQMIFETDFNSVWIEQLFLKSFKKFSEANVNLNSISIGRFVCVSMLTLNAIFLTNMPRKILVN